ncbi:ACT domain-containing protein ACR3 isoform X4 [Camellia sinensis]|uniref:ACT domain-containing protein ACR3 isoform X4 n=1 Tax=Camellia sinensis TaxID=4442 RepID=UPI0010362797|nr:ACT domain-containing protein ACR3 isoform X4 [Camellia sinensis]
MAGNSWPYFDPEYENLSIKINPPRVSIDNTTCKDCTLIKVDSMNRPGILLEVVQILTDLDLTITKAYISSDGGWFMDVFHVTDQQGNKITDSKTIDFIEKALGPKGYTKDGSKSWPEKRVGMHSLGEHTAIELVGRDRPGLLSEISAVLANLHFNVVAAEVWTHNRRTACVLYVNDNTTCHAVDDPSRLSTMEEQLKNILRGCEDDEKVGCTSFSMGITHVDRRLHQMMLADRDYEGVTLATETDYPPLEPKITVDRCEEKGYSVVSVKCKDRAKLMFDIVCTLTDMQYVVFHANISSDGPYASQGLSLELCAKDRVGLLSEVTRVFRENGLSVTRAGVTTVGEQAMNVFYMSDASGNPVDTKTIETLRKEIGQTMMLNVKKIPTSAEAAEASGCTKTSFVFGSLLERFLA